MNTPKISIVIPTYGRAEYLKKLITSIRDSTPTDAYEFIVVSSDSAESQKVKWLSNQPDVRLVMADSNYEGRRKSLYYYTNLGIYLAKNEWILVVNDDMIFDKEWYSYLNKLVSKPEYSNAGMIIVAAHIGDVALGCRIAKIGRTQKSNAAWKDLYLSDFSLIHRDVLKQIDYFDENLDWYGSGADNSLAVEFLTDKDTLLEEKIKITHFIDKENRETRAGNSFYDFSYLIRKWDKWCTKNNCKYECGFGFNPYTIKNRLKYLIHRLAKPVNTVKKTLKR